MAFLLRVLLLLGILTSILRPPYKGQDILGFSRGIIILEIQTRRLRGVFLALGISIHIFVLGIPQVFIPYP